MLYSIPFIGVSADLQINSFLPHIFFFWGGGRGGGGGGRFLKQIAMCIQCSIEIFISLSSFATLTIKKPFGRGKHEQVESGVYNK